MISQNMLPFPCGRLVPYNTPLIRIMHTALVSSSFSSLACIFLLFRIFFSSLLSIVSSSLCSAEKKSERPYSADTDSRDNKRKSKNNCGNYYCFGSAVAKIFD